jgi:hypothetical protein
VALLQPKINQVVLAKIKIECAEIFKKYADDLFDWEGEFAVIAEFADNKVLSKACNEVVKKFKAELKKARQEAILTTFKKPRKIKPKGEKE